MVCKSYPAPAVPPAIRSPFFVRVTWNYGKNNALHDMNRETLPAAALAVVAFLDDCRRDGTDHVQYIRTIEVGDHRDGSLREVSLDYLYRIAGRPRQTTIAEYGGAA